MSELITICRDDLKRLSMPEVQTVLDLLRRGAPPSELAGPLRSVFLWEDALSMSCADVSSRGLLASRRSLSIVYHTFKMLVKSESKVFYVIDHGEVDFNTSTHTKKRIHIGSCDEIGGAVAVTMVSALLGGTSKRFVGHPFANICGSSSVAKALDSDFSELSDVEHYNVRAFLNAVLNGKKTYGMLVSSDVDKPLVHASVLWRF